MSRSEVDSEDFYCPAHNKKITLADLMGDHKLCKGTTEFANAASDQLKSFNSLKKSFDAEVDSKKKDFFDEILKNFHEFKDEIVSLLEKFEEKLKEGVSKYSDYILEDTDFFNFLNKTEQVLREGDLPTASDMLNDCNDIKTDSLREISEKLSKGKASYIKVLKEDNLIFGQLRAAINKLNTSAEDWNKEDDLEKIVMDCTIVAREPEVERDLIINTQVPMTQTIDAMANGTITGNHTMAFEADSTAHMNDPVQKLEEERNRLIRLLSLVQRDVRNQGFFDQSHKQKVKKYLTLFCKKNEKIVTDLKNIFEQVE